MGRPRKPTPREIAIIEDEKRKNWYLSQEKTRLTDYERFYMCIFLDGLETMEIIEKEDAIDDRHARKRYYYIVEDNIIANLNMGRSFTNGYE